MHYLVDQLGVDKDLVFEFFLYFSRFEYALKREGFCKSSRRAICDWDKFFSDHSKQIHELCLNSKYAKELIGAPPKKQINDNGNLGWSETNFSSEPTYKKLCFCIKGIRNNLFHGGKFPEGPEEDVARNEVLIQAALNTLKKMSDFTILKKHFNPENF